MADGSSAPAKKGFFKAAMGGVVGLAAGVVGVYSTALIDKVAKPSKPVANFAVSADGLVLTCQNHASGQSGWWDFGDGTPLEPFNAEQTTVSHTYAKPGSYSVKLTVRNFLSEENDRTVPVDLTTTSVAQGGPVIPSFSVEPVGNAAVAPATFRVRGEVKGADRVIWDLGTEKLEVADSPGTFEKLVVFEKPGPYQVQLIGYSGKQAVKRAAQVNVSEARAGSLSVTLRVTDSGTSVERKEMQQMIAMQIPAKDATKFERIVHARPGYTIAEARIGKLTSTVMKNLTVEVAGDKKSVKLVGEWTGSGDAAVKAAGGSDVMIPLLLTQECATALPTNTATVAVPLELSGGFVMMDPSFSALTATLPLPPVPTNTQGFQRKIAFELRETGGDRQGRVIGALAELKPPFKASVTSLSGRKYILDTQIVGGQLRVTLTPENAGRS